MAEEEHSNIPAIRKAMEFKSAGMLRIAEGMASLNRAHEDLPEPIALTEPVGLEHAKTLYSLVRPVPNMRAAIIETAMTAVMRNRRKPAGLAFTELRHSFARDRDWVAFCKIDLPKFCADRGLAPFTLEGIERLIGEVASMKGLAICAKCTAMVVCQCGCNAPYIPQVPWSADEIDDAVAADDPIRAIPALQRAKDALLADPSKHDRTIAREIGVSHQTVGRARAQMEAKQSLGPHDGPAPPQPTQIPANDDYDLVQDVPDDIAEPSERWWWSLGAAAGDAIAMTAYWTRNFGDWRNFDKPPELLNLARQAADAWLDVIKELEGRKPS